MTSARANPLSIGFQVAIYFAANRDEALTVDDICIKTGATPASAARAMRQARDAGLVSVEADAGASGQPNLYTPGPALLRLLGVAA